MPYEKCHVIVKMRSGARDTPELIHHGFRDFGCNRSEIIEVIVETSVVICEERGILGTFVCHEHNFKRFLEQRSLSTCASFFGWQRHFVPFLHKLIIISGNGYPDGPLPQDETSRHI
jgi:hypothetical protein